MNTEKPDDDIIITDADTADEDHNDSGSLYPYELKDDTYLKAVRFSTGNKTSVINRFQLAQEILGSV